MVIARHVMGTSETRKKLPKILEAFRASGSAAEPVFIGAYRHIEAVLLPAALAEKLAPVIEDMVAAERARARSEQAGDTVSREDIVRRLGLDESTISEQTASLLALYGDQEQ